MKRKFKILGSTLIVLFAIYSCEKNETEPFTDPVELKRANNGMINSYDNTMVILWNEALSLAVDAKVPLPVESRIYAMVTLAMHDALNYVVPKYETYAMDNSWNDGKEVSKKTIDPVADAAVAQAAHDVLVNVFPPAKPGADDLLATCLSAIEDSELKTEGIHIGQKAALAILAKRQNDVLPAFEAYPQGTAPGEYRSYLPWSNPGPAWPANAVFGPKWGTTTPFGILSGDQFRSAPPFAINSPEYTADYNEVKTIGSNTSAVRTPEQTAMGIFFTDNMPSMINRMAKYVAESEELNGWETARLFALTQMACADAVICTFDASFHYNFWRPVTAIRDGATDGNSDTEGDISWNAVTAGRAIPPLPSYPSGYAAAGKAGTEICKMFFGTDEKSFTVGSYTLPGPERTYVNFSKLADDMALSRIYVGHNFRNDNTAGSMMGKDIAKYVFVNNLQELKQNSVR